MTGFKCPHCGDAAGWQEIVPVRGIYIQVYDANGEGTDGEYACTYFSQSRKCRCNSCGRTITGYINKWLERRKDKNDT